MIQNYKEQTSVKNKLFKAYLFVCAAFMFMSLVVVSNTLYTNSFTPDYTSSVSTNSYGEHWYEVALAIFVLPGSAIVLYKTFTILDRSMNPTLYEKKNEEALLS